MEIEPDKVKPDLKNRRANDVSVAPFPEKVIKNGLIRAKLYLPHSEKGYYRSTRIDWSGVISSLENHGKANAETLKKTT